MLTADQLAAIRIELEYGRRGIWTVSLFRAAEQLLAEVERLREHSVTLNTVGFKLAEALGDVPDGQDWTVGNPVEQAERLIKAKAEALAEAERLRGELEDAERVRGEVLATTTWDDDGEDRKRVPTFEIRDIFTRADRRLERRMAAVDALDVTTPDKIEPDSDVELRSLRATKRQYAVVRQRIADLMGWCAQELGRSHIHEKIREHLAIPDGAYPWQTPHPEGSAVSAWDLLGIDAEEPAARSETSVEPCQAVSPVQDHLAQGVPGRVVTARSFLPDGGTTTPLLDGNHE